MPRQPRNRAFCFTLNNPTPEEVSSLKAIQLDEKLSYLIFGKEVSDSGTPHLQGFIRFKNPIRALSAKEWISPRAHIEIANGSATQNKIYCSKGLISHADWTASGVDHPDYGKDADVYELGECPKGSAGGGAATKAIWQDAYDHARLGNLDEIDPTIVIKHYGNLVRIASAHQRYPESLQTLDFHWWYGPTGTGKSRTARLENPAPYLKRINKWWDGFKDQDCVLIEEWSPSVVPALQEALKQWCDHHPFSAEIKGSSICIRPRKIIITSNYTLEECFPQEQVLQPLRRRLQVRRFDYNEEYPDPNPPTPISSADPRVYRDSAGHFIIP